MKVLIVIIALLGTLDAAHSQTRNGGIDTEEGNILRFTVPAQNHFLDEHTEIVSFSLRSDTVFSIHIIPRKDDTAYLNREFLTHPFGGKMFSFDLDFEADRLVFAKKYSRIPQSAAPAVKVLNSRGQKYEDKLYKIISMRFYNDSTEYTYGWNYDFGKPGIGRPAQYKGDIDEMEAGIAREVAVTSIKAPFDSVLVFQALVRRYSESTGYGIFELERLLYGKSSDFSEIAVEYLQSKENNFFDDGKPKWIAAWIERRINSRVKVYVRLNRDGSVTIKLPKRLQNFTGD